MTTTDGVQATLQVLTKESPEALVDRGAGSKGRNLYLLDQAGVDVPEWAILGVDAFSAHRAAHSLDDRLGELLHGLTPENAGAVASEAERLVTSPELPPAVAALVEQAVAALPDAPLAVRSSGAEEDGETYSFAGQFATFLNVRGVDAVATAVKACWASAYSERSLLYRLRHGILDDSPDIAVVLQRLVPSRKSGVAFTCNPWTGRRDELVVSAVYGLGEGLVSGAVDADTVRVDRRTGVVIETTVGEKSQRFIATDDGDGCEIDEVAVEQRWVAALDAAEIQVVREAAERVESLFGSPQDIEWAFDGDGTLWLLQSRPVTHLDSMAEAKTDADATEMRIWDNSNIIESYNGVTSPLTFSFAHYVYYRVYVEYYRLLGVPEKDLHHAEQWLRNMLAYFNGRVYYNLLHWYKMIRPLPLYRMNRLIMELGLGVDEALDAETADAIRTFDRRSEWGERLLRIKVGAKFVAFSLTMDRAVEQFRRDFYRAYDQFDAVDYDELSAEEVYRRFEALEQDVLLKWGKMLALEPVVGLTFGALDMLTKRWLPDASPSFRFEAVKPSGEVESMEPAEELRRMAKHVLADEALSALVRETPPDEAMGALQAAGQTEFLAMVESYIARYGYRSFNELKLEEPDLREEPAGLFLMLRSTMSFQPPASDIASNDPDAYIKANLSGLRRLAYELVRRKVRKSLRQRESVRFCRTRAFGTVKKMVRAMGRDLAAMGAIDDPRDVFYLRLEELRGCFDATTGMADLRPLVAIRKQEEANAHAVVDAPGRFVTYGAPYWRDNLPRGGWRRSGDEGGAALGEEGGLLSGTPCSPGVVEGEAVIVTEPQDVDGRILIAYRTDPGWVTALPSAAALVIERGSPLTHVAIVAREMGLPTVVQVKDVTKIVAAGMRIRVDGTTGRIEILKAATA